MKKRIAIVGLGKKGRKHLSELRRSDYFELVALFEPSIEEEFLRFEVFDDIDTMFNRAKPEAVVINTPYKTHKDMISKCMKYVKNIFVETPFVDSLESARQMKYMADTNNLKIAVGFSQRFNPTVISLRKELSKENKIHTINFTHGVYCENKEINVVDNMLIPNLDLLRYITKSELCNMDFKQNSCKNQKDICVLVASLKTKSDILINLTLNSFYPTNRSYMEISTDSGIYLADLVNFTLHKITQSGRINLKVESEDFSIRMEHKEFLNICYGEDFKDLASVEDVIKAREVFK